MDMTIRYGNQNHIWIIFKVKGKHCTFYNVKWKNISIPRYLELVKYIEFITAQRKKY